MDNETSEATAVLTTVESTSASFAEIKAACVGADAEFICAQLERKATVAEATSAWMTEQNARIEAAKAEVLTAKAAQIGVEAFKSTLKKEEASEEPPGEGFMARVSELRAKGMERRAAIAAAQKEMPEAHLEYLRSTNPKRLHKLIDERADVA